MEFAYDELCRFMEHSSATVISQTAPKREYLGLLCRSEGR